MFARLFSLGVWALDGFVVTTEVDVSGGLPQFAIVGLPDSAVKEATDRVRSAMRNTGFDFPARRITVNLAPADTKKTGSVYDLPVLLGLLAATEQIPHVPDDSAFIGELSLDGTVRGVSGVLPMVIACKKAGIKKLFLPAANVMEAAVIDDVDIYPVNKVADVTGHLKGESLINKAGKCKIEFENAYSEIADFKDVFGQYEARRALEIAAAGMHNVVLVGPPGAGKSMLAKRLPSILPPLNREEAIEVSAIYSIANVNKNEAGKIITKRPFRSPHHSVSASALSGGGSIPKPGEISLAHKGVLFLDELPEFQRDVLETLRQPMEDGVVTVSRVAGKAVYPSKFMFVGAMNPCPCGYFGHPVKDCRCSLATIDKYMQKISGPLLDRIDLHVEVSPVEYEDMSSAKNGEESGEILKRVIAAREFATKRCENLGVNFASNAYLEGESLRRACILSEGAKNVMKMAFEKMGLSARAYDKVLKISRTIADLQQSEEIEKVHVQEAVQYRNLDRKYFFTR